MKPQGGSHQYSCQVSAGPIPLCGTVVKFLQVLYPCVVQLSYFCMYYTLCCTVVKFLQVLYPCVVQLSSICRYYTPVRYSCHVSAGTIPLCGTVVMFLQVLYPCAVQLSSFCTYYTLVMYMFFRHYAPVRYSCQVSRQLLLSTTMVMIQWASDVHQAFTLSYIIGESISITLK